jgi:ribosomal protein S18 acetylase RimI-like enzyme
MSAEAIGSRVASFASLLHACVQDGASVSFVLPFTLAEAAGFWTNKIIPSAARGTRVVFAAVLDDEVAGSVQLDLDMPPNQGHRAEVSKLLVHPRFRRRGLARRLMLRLEDEAKARGRTLITLDTRTGDKAETLYTKLGYNTAGTIPCFACDPREHRLDATTYMYKLLGPVPESPDAP